ncbi:MAG TPA: hypothetical protein VMG34_12175 [Bacteroidota bacterium]|nr:hypothetical protein [Bacteroidota bacterium]
MSIAFFLDLGSFILLIGAFAFLLRERRQFYALKWVLPAFFLLSVGRICDMSLEHPTFRLSNVFGLSPYPFELVFAITGNITDVVGICFLIYGFVRIKSHEQEEKKRIKELENLLPICSGCKKFRNEAGQWLPIEEYLMEKDSLKLSHGVCPDCLQLYYPEYAGRLRRRRGRK